MKLNINVYLINITILVFTNNNVTKRIYLGYIFGNLFIKLRMNIIVI